MEPRRLRVTFEQLVLGLQELGLGCLAPRPVEAERSVGGGHRPVGVRQEDDLGSLQSEYSPALEEVAVVADRGSDHGEPEVVDRPFGGLAEEVELVEGGMDLALEPDQAVRPDQRTGVVVRAAELLAETVGDDDLAFLRAVVDGVEDRAVMALGDG